MGDINVFDEYAEFYGCNVVRDYDYFFIDFIKENKKASLLDVGGGSGTFASLTKDSYPKMDVVVIDPSQTLLDRISDERIRKYYGRLPDKLYLNEGVTFDYIHIKEVLHHIVGTSVSESMGLIRESLINLRKYLKDDGFIFIHELFYESILIPPLSRDFIFYISKLQNNSNLKFLPKEFLMGLVVCFYTRDEFRRSCSKADLN